MPEVRRVDPVSGIGPAISKPSIKSLGGPHPRLQNFSGVPEKPGGFVVSDDGDSVKAALVPFIRSLRHIVGNGDKEFSFGALLSPGPESDEVQTREGAVTIRGTASNQIHIEKS